MAQAVGDMQARTWPRRRQPRTEPERHSAVTAVMDDQSRRQRLLLRGPLHRVEMAQRHPRQPLKCPGHARLYPLPGTGGLGEDPDGRRHVRHRCDQHQAGSRQPVQARDRGGKTTHRVGHDRMGRTVVPGSRAKGGDHFRQQGPAWTVRAGARVTVPGSVQRDDTEPGPRQRPDKTTPRRSIPAPAMQQVHRGAFAPRLGDDTGGRPPRQVHPLAVAVRHSGGLSARHGPRQRHQHPDRRPGTQTRRGTLGQREPGPRQGQRGPSAPRPGTT